LDRKIDRKKYGASAQTYCKFSLAAPHDVLLSLPRSLVRTAPEIPAEAPDRGAVEAKGGQRSESAKCLVGIIMKGHSVIDTAK